MTSSEVDVFSRLIESKLQKLSASSALMFSIDHAMEPVGSAAEGMKQVVHRVMRVVSSLESSSPEPFQPIRRLAW